MIKYTVEKQITTEWVVVGESLDLFAEEKAVKVPVARCPTQGLALTIAGMYNESEEREGEEGEKYD